MPFVVAGVDTSIAWTTADATVTFEGHNLTLRPGSQTLYPTVVLEYQPDTKQAHMEAVAVIRRFLSSLAWTERFAVHIETVGGGGFPIQLGRAEVGGVTLLGRWRSEYVVETADSKARLALALYREALVLASVSVPYAFLGFFKILNIGLPDGKKQIAWTNTALNSITDHRAVARITELRASVPDVGDYLYASGRCAVAHAFNNPTVDPDDTADTFRLSSDLPVAQALAERFIESELGIKSYHTILSEHLYELDGFRGIIGEELVGRLKAGEAPQIAQPPAFPLLTIRMDGRDAGVEFSGLRVNGLGVAAGVLVLFCGSQDGRLTLDLGLDFGSERLAFDPERGMRIEDDGQPEAVDHAIMRLKFFRGMVLNGRTEVYNAETGERLGRTDAHVGMNIDLGATIESLDRKIERLVAMRAKRSLPPAV